MLETQRKHKEIEDQLEQERLAILREIRLEKQREQQEALRREEPPQVQARP